MTIGKKSAEQKEFCDSIKGDKGESSKRPKSAYERSSWLSRCFYLFVWPLAVKSRTKPTGLTPSDFDDQAPSDSLAASAHLSLEANWRREMETNRKQPSMLRTIIRTHGWKLAGIYLIDILAEVIIEPIYFYFNTSLIEAIGAYLAARNLAREQSLDMETRFPEEENYNANVQYNCSQQTGICMQQFSNQSRQTLDLVESESNLESLKWNMIMVSIVFSITMILTISLVHPFTWLTSRLGLRIRASLARMIYEKSLKIDKSSSKVSYKQAISLISRDIDMLDTDLAQVAWMIVGPGESIALSIVLSQTIGLATTGFSFVLNGIIAFQRGYMNIKVTQYTRAAANLADSRIAISSEAFYAVRILRMCTWTRKMVERIQEARAKEVDKRRIRYYLTCLDTTIFFAGCSVVSILTLMFGHYFADLEISQRNISSVFLVTGLYRRTISRYLPQGILAFTNLKIIFERVSDYLAAEEVPSRPAIVCEQPDGHDNCCAQDSGPECALKALRESESDVGLQFIALSKPILMLQLEQVSASWLGGQQICLNHVDLAANSGELLMIAGRVGSGKSSLLQVILEELPASSGSLQRFGSVSYASQEPWIFTGTIRENIIMGANHFNSHRYIEVLRVCSLLADLQTFPMRDMTLIGERGVTLSGGQKARINLARCLYQEADIYLLDDPLSAVDAHVAQHIFDEAIRRYLAPKCTLLATHQLQFLSRADKILLLDELQPGEGYSSISGSYTELIATKSLLSLIATPSPEGGTPTGGRGRLEPQGPGDEKRMYAKYEPIEQSILESGAQSFGPETNKLQKIETDIISEIEADTGVMKSIKFYIQNCTSNWGFIVFIYNNTAIRILFLGSSTWLGYWAGVRNLSIGSESSFLATVASEMSFANAIKISLLLWLCLALTAAHRSYQLGTGVTRGARNIHNRLIESVLWAKTSFFDVTPLGDLINRISADLSCIDTQLVSCFEEISLGAISILVMTSFIVASDLLLMVLVVPIFLSVYFLWKYLVRILDVVKRLDGQRRSAVYTHTGITLDGLSTIRASNKQQVFLDRFNETLDRHSSVWFVNLGLRRLLINGIDWITLLFYLFIVVTVVIDTLIGGGAYAFVALYMLQLMTRSLQANIALLVQIYTSAQSIGRIQQYLGLEPEQNRAEIRQRESELAKFERGQLVFLGVSLKYAHTSEIVLKDLSFTIEAREKIGIVGRTGAGKSSIIAILFELYHFEGFVFIDGQDTKQLDLDSVRRSISIIPQDPVLFSGTLRLNLDPMDEFSDEDLWRALDAVQMHQLVKANSRMLDMGVAEGGSNFSVGQRQLVCLARAILRRNKLLVLDEATANVDPETDQLIQRAIRLEFANCTVLTVAHRLNTIVDSDRIMVMDSGRLIEFDTPARLLEREGAFARMIADSGGQADELRAKIMGQSQARL